MPARPEISNPITALTEVVREAITDSRWLVARAVFRGAAVGSGGALVMSTLIGVAAVVGMVDEGLSPQSIAQQMHGQLDIRWFVTVGDLLMAMLAGYAAAVVAGQAYLRHAIAAGGATLGMNLLVIALCGSPLSFWHAAASLALIVPCAALGGYLASPIIERSSTK
ncbi:MAG TPA: hypothetical protein VGY55_04105 [Pirellulales bacterium]|jgi:hypothetical protein|nr:hypothetical protein [Pirellulales bacterium]